jgi:small subunit ribosomal protein S16
MNGAQPSDTVKAMLSYRGILMRKHLQIGVLKGALTQEQADAKLTEWVKSKEAKLESKREKITMTKQQEAKARREAETKIKEARAESIRQKQKVAEAAAAPAPEEAAAPAAEGSEAQA